MFRKNAEEWLKAHPMKLGGSGKTVEVDETCISGKIKYKKGASRGTQIWLFGSKYSHFILSLPVSYFYEKYNFGWLAV